MTCEICNQNKATLISTDKNEASVCEACNQDELGIVGCAVPNKLPDNYESDSEYIEYMTDRLGGGR